MLMLKVHLCMRGDRFFHVVRSHAHAFLDF